MPRPDWYFLFLFQMLTFFDGPRYRQRRAARVAVLALLLVPSLIAQRLAGRRSGPSRSGSGVSRDQVVEPDANGDPRNATHRRGVVLAGGPLQWEQRP
jgi:hypothetical protein